MNLMKQWQREKKDARGSGSKSCGKYKLKTDNIRIMIKDQIRQEKRMERERQKCTNRIRINCNSIQK